jgi:uncharacterized protein (DUF58 family)
MLNGGSEQFFSPELMEKVARLELRARSVADGLLSGMHKSAARGFNVEFLEHREYSPGDDIRHIDWKVFARTGRYYVKQHEEEKNLQVLLIVDASESMGYGGEGGGAKWEHCCLISAALAYLFLKQGDAVGLRICGAGAPAPVEPRAARGQIYRILGALAAQRPRGQARLADALRAAGDQLKRRGFVIVVSDLLEEPEPVREGLRVIRGRGSDAVVFHLLDESEITFPFTRASRFIDPETGRDLTTDPTAVRALYMKNLGRFLADYRDFSDRIGIDFIPASTADGAERILLGYLERRERRKRR